MNPQTISLILALIPIAEKLVFQIGGKMVELNTEGITTEDLVAAIQQSKSSNWPELKFTNTVT